MSTSQLSPSNLPTPCSGELAAATKQLIGVLTSASAVRSLIQDEYAVDLQHLRRFAKLHDLPPHLKSLVSPSQTTAHVANGQTSLCLLVAPTVSIDLLALKDCISNVLP